MNWQAEEANMNELVGEVVNPRSMKEVEKDVNDLTDLYIFLYDVVQKGYVGADPAEIMDHIRRMDRTASAMEKRLLKLKCYAKYFLELPTPRRDYYQGMLNTVQHGLCCVYGAHILRRSVEN